MAKVNEKSDKLFNFDSEFDQLVKSIPGIIWVDTLEEERFIEELMNDVRSVKMGSEGLVAEQKHNINVFMWSMSSGMLDITSEVDPLFKIYDDEPTKNPINAINNIVNNKNDNTPSLYIMRGLGDMMKVQPIISRKIKDIYKVLYKSNKILLITATNTEIPINLDKNITYYSYKCMTSDKINSYLTNKLNALKGQEVTKKYNLKVDYTAEELNGFSNACLGLAENEMRKIVNLELNKRKEIVTLDIIKEKKRSIEKSGVLEYWEKTEAMDNVGGMGALKLWLKKRKHCLSDDAKKFGLPVPRGILMVGPPGCGKSLGAKAAASEFELPLVRMDVGKLMGGLVGASESNMRKAIEVIEGNAPCVTGDTIIELESGNKVTIAELYNGRKENQKYKIKGYDPDTHQVVYLELYDIIQRNALDKPLLEFELDNGNKIKVTENHKLLINCDGKSIWKEAKDITMDDDIIVQ